MALAACHTEAKVEGSPVDAQTSPQAKAEPAPLTSVVAAASGTNLSDAGPAPSTLRGDRVTPGERVAESLAAHAKTKALT